VAAKAAEGMSSKMKPTHFSKVEEFHIGDLVRCDTGRKETANGAFDSTYVLLVERRAAGLIWNALFPNGNVWKVTWDQLSK